MSRRVLMICHAFPPTGGSGVQRSVKFAKYLPRFGWEPLVWTAPPSTTLPVDESLCRDAAGTRVWRAAPRGMPTTHRGARNDPRPARRHWRLERLAAGLKHRVLIPDEGVGWALAGLGPLRALVQREHVAALYSTYSPASNHLLGWLLHRGTRLPWLADFRDLWTQDYRYPFGRAARWRRSVDRWLERKFLESATAVVGVTEPQTRRLAEQVQDRVGKFLTIANGVDPDDFPESRYSRGDRLVLAYVGRFTGECITPALLEGLARFHRGSATRGGRIELRIVGPCAEPLRAPLLATGLSCVFRGYVPHAEAIREMQAADALLLAVSDRPGAETVMTGKIFEYLASGRPIVAVAPEASPAAELVRRMQAGVVVAHDPEQISAAMVRLLDRWSAGMLPNGCAADRLGPYTRLHQTSRLARVLDQIVRISPHDSVS